MSISHVETIVSTSTADIGIPPRVVHRVSYLSGATGSFPSISKGTLQARTPMLWRSLRGSILCLSNPSGLSHRPYGRQSDAASRYGMFSQCGRSYSRHWYPSEFSPHNKPAVPAAGCVVAQTRHICIHRLRPTPSPLSQPSP